jgi:outer membrane protein assembly factor BamB
MHSEDAPMKGPQSYSMIRLARMWRGMSVAPVMLLLAACGGGGSSVYTGATLYLSTTNLSVSATNIDQAPAATIQANVMGLSDNQVVYLSEVNTDQGISEVTYPTSQNTQYLPANYSIQFYSPTSLGVGTYNDTVRITACIDQACKQQIAGSPQILQVHYTVTKPTGSLTLKSISPTQVTVGGAAFNLTVLGTNFSTDSSVQWNGTTLNTAYVSHEELLAQVPATDISATGSASVIVSDPINSPTRTASQKINIVPASIDAVGFQMNAAHTGAVTFKSVSFPSSATWSVDVGGTPSYAVIANGLVIVTVNLSDGSSKLLALDQNTGNTVWGPIAISAAANAVYDDGRVFVLSGPIATTATLEAFDAHTGALDWSTNLTGQYTFTAAPTAADGTVYVIGTGVGSTLYARNESTGTPRWAETLNDGDNITPAVTADGIYLSYKCATHDLRPANGESIWDGDTACGSGGGGSPVAVNGLLYSPNGTSGGEVFDAETGTNLGTYSASSPPAFTTSMGYFLQGGTLSGVKLSNNTTQWSFTGDGQLVGAPVVVNQYVFIGSGSGNLYGLDGTTGDQVWNVNLGDGIDWDFYYSMPFTGLAAGDGLLVVPSGTTVTAYTLSTDP